MMKLEQNECKKCVVKNKEFFSESWCLPGINKKFVFLFIIVLVDENTDFYQLV